MLPGGTRECREEASPGKRKEPSKVWLQAKCCLLWSCRNLRSAEISLQKPPHSGSQSWAFTLLNQSLSSLRLRRHGILSLKWLQEPKRRPLREAASPRVLEGKGATGWCVLQIKIKGMEAGHVLSWLSKIKAWEWDRVSNFPSNLVFHVFHQTLLLYVSTGLPPASSVSQLPVQEAFYDHHV